MRLNSLKLPVGLLERLELHLVLGPLEPLELKLLVLVLVLVLVVQLEEQHFHKSRRCSWFGCNFGNRLLLRHRCN